MRNVEFINAGAGSGKTHRLVSLLSGYLGGDYGEYDPEEVVLTTFTELAAGEFRERARDTLLKNGQFEKASRLGSASIGTVHAVAYSFIRKYWYLLGRGPADNVISESDKQFYINQSLANIAVEADVEFFESMLREFGFSKFEDNKSADNPDFWKDDLRCIIDKAEQYGIETYELSLGRSAQFIDRIFSEDARIDSEWAIGVLKNYVQICNNQERKKKAQKIINAGALNYSDLVEISGLGPIDKERAVLPGIDALVASALRASRSVVYGEKLKLYAQRIFGLAAIWKSEYNRFKAKNRLIDYNDMERLFLELLQKDEILAEMRDKCKLVLVDEFQDSSPVQIRIFDKLSDIAEKSIWVGDPKQAIYGFRGSDTLLIKSVIDIFNRGDAEKNLRLGTPLNTSYRSRGTLVQLANHVFARAFGEMDPEHVRLNQDRNDEAEFKDSAPGHALRHWHFNKCENRRSKTDHFQNLAQKIIGLLNERTLIYDKSSRSVREAEPEDIAVLCRTNRDVNDLAGILREYGIKTTGQTSGGSFVETAEIRLFLAILNYVLNRNNDLAKAEILHLSDNANYPVGEIIRSRIDFIPRMKEALEAAENDAAVAIPKWADDNPLIRKINSISADIEILPVPDMVEALIILLDLRTIVARWGDADRRTRNIDALMKHAAEYDQRALQLGLGASLNNFIVYLNNLSGGEEKAEKVKGAVNILTYHKAKGLEWNMVILESLDFDELETGSLIRKSFFGVNDFISGTPAEGELFPERYVQLLPWFYGSKKELSDDIRALVEESDEFKYLVEKTRSEIRRLLYVGVTRARDYLVTTSYHDDLLSWLGNIGCGAVNPESVTDGSADIWNSPYHSAFSRHTKDPAFDGVPVDTHLTGLVKPEGQGETGPRYLSPSRRMLEVGPEVSLLHNFNHRIAIQADAGQGDNNATDAMIGTCLHDIFCIYRPGLAQNMENAELVLSNRNMAGVFPEPQRILVSMDNLYGFLETRYPGSVKIHRELPVIQAIDDGHRVIRGSCDLVWETEAGCVLVDYKSFPGAVANVVDPANGNYAGKYTSQLYTYRSVLEAAGMKVKAMLIYYAVMGAVVEVSIKDVD